MSRKKRPVPVPPDRLYPCFDSHTHLGSVGAHSGEEIAAVMDRAEAVGVVGVCTVGDGVEEARAAIAAAHLDTRVVAAAAVHPTRANELDELSKTQIAELARDERCVAVGECGLDWYWLDKSENCASRETQLAAFRWHIDLAKQVDKPLMIHNREADEDLLRVLSEEGAPKEVILHCFSSSLAVAHQALDRGFVLSFSGNVSFNANDELRAAAKACPPEQILAETDAPYMTPMPFRGARNEPQFLPYTVRALANARGVEAEEAAILTTANAHRLYRR